MQREGFRVTAAFESEHWWFRSRRELFLRQVARASAEAGVPRAACRLLDYGCGTGYSLRFLAEFGEAWGADVPSAHGAEFRRATDRPILELGSDLAHQQGRFHVVTALDVLEHMDDDVAGLVAIGSFLAPGGQIVLTVPAYAWLWGDEDEISDHRRRYTRSRLLEACRAAGFEPRFASYFNLSILPAAAAAAWSHRLRPYPRAARSNLDRSPRWLDPWLYRITAFEARRVGEERWRLPAGASLVCRCVRRV